LYLRHVAVKQEARGIGSVLEYKLFKEAKSKGYKNLLGEILREPVKNKKSMAFHRALGFKVIGEIPEEGMVWDLVLKNLEEGK
jgi:L-amino acid N-acyltransferase YncA